MTPQLMQAIKLLQLSNLDLAAYVEGELERNPLLERGATSDGPGDARADSQPPESSDQTAMPAVPTGWVTTSRPAAAPSSSSSAPSSKMCFPTMAASDAAREHRGAAAGHSEWAGAGTGGASDGDYNLEAFVSAETNARRSSGRATGAGDRRSGAAA